MFEDEEQTKCFMDVAWEFSNLVIDQEDDEVIEEQQKNWEETIIGHKNLQLKRNTIPKGLVPLEKIFNLNDVVAKSAK